MTVRVLALLVLLIPLCAAAPAYAAGSLNILAYSQQSGEANASAGSRVSYASHEQGAAERRPVLNGTSGGAASAGGGEPAGPNPYPAISSSSPLLHNPHPNGPQSFWYTAEGHRCIYFPTSNGICYTVTTPAATGTPGRPAINPAAIAEALAARMNLQAGQLSASPSPQAKGLTGAASWFWLSPTPRIDSLSVSLAGEHVTVTATASSVRWSFGDGSELAAGPGVPYQPEGVPSAAVHHVYQTRCLPGDRGRDPNVLASCGSNGYTVQATVQWSIGYTASGPVGGGGALPSRSTATSLVYPVSEARAFLTSAGREG